MHQHQLGATGALVTRLGLGLAALGRPGYINLGHAHDLGGDYAINAMSTHTHALLDAAWQAGIRYFDVARSYGRAEEFLSKWLNARSIAPDDVVVGSKWGYTYTAGWQVQAEQHEVKEHSLPVLQRQWRESQTFLGGYLRLYQIHSATLESGVLENRAVLHELVRLKQTGVLIGLSLSGAQQVATLEAALHCTVDGVCVFDGVQATWNLLERSVGPMLSAAHALGLGVIVKEALANGRLTKRNLAPDFAGKLACLEQQAARLQTTVDALALAAVFAQPWADVVLSGAATVAQLQANLGALHVTWDSEASQALSGLVETPAHYWRTRSQLAWN
jgi:aryl-alcohol dehydrogenase-like predicted oxidoreductase